MLTTHTIIKRLQSKMGPDQYKKLIQTIEVELNKTALNDDNTTEMFNTLYKKYVHPQIRQHGNKVTIKTRKVIYQLNDLNLFKYNSEQGKILQDKIRSSYEPQDKFDDLDYEIKYDMVINLGIKEGLLTEVLNYSLWLNRNIYHWGKTYNGWKIYGEAESNRESTNDWSVSEKYNISYFTMYSNNDIEQYCDTWVTKNEFTDVNDGYKFITKLISYMELLEFA